MSNLIKKKQEDVFKIVTPCTHKECPEYDPETECCHYAIVDRTEENGKVILCTIIMQ